MYFGWFSWTSNLVEKRLQQEWFKNCKKWHPVLRIYILWFVLYEIWLGFLLSMFCQSEFTNKHSIVATNCPTWKMINDGERFKFNIYRNWHLFILWYHFLHPTFLSDSMLKILTQHQSPTPTNFSYRLGIVQQLRNDTIYPLKRVHVNNSSLGMIYLQ